MTQSRRAKQKTPTNKSDSQIMNDIVSSFVFFSLPRQTYYYIFGFTTTVEVLSLSVGLLERALNVKNFILERVPTLQLILFSSIFFFFLFIGTNRRFSLAQKNNLRLGTRVCDFGETDSTLRLLLGVESIVTQINDPSG